MRIKRLTLNNIGSFAGEHSFLFQTDNSQKQIVLIGGRNGAGKTTLFESIRLCLYGYKLYGYRQNSQTYTNKIKRLINDKVRSSSPATAGITMQILIEDGYANSVFEISREWILNGNTLKESLCVYKDGDLLTPEQMQDFDNYLMQIIPPALFNFHFFDGEKVSNFMFDRANGQAFRKAFLQICGLDTFDLIEEQLQYNTRTKKGDSQNLIQEEYATARMKLAEAKESHIASLQKIQETQAEIDALQDQITILDADMKKYGGVEDDDWKLYEKEIQEEESKREELRHILKAAANDAIPFIILKDQLQALKHQLTVEGKLKRNRLFKDKFSDPNLKEKLQQELKVGTDSPQIELSDEFMLALYKTLREDISEHEVEFLRISENDSMELLPKIKRKPREIWDAATIRKALDECKDGRLYVAINLSFACSLRIGEIVGLTWDNIHISDADIASDNAYLCVEKELVRVREDSLAVLGEEEIIKKFPRTMYLEDASTVIVLKTPKTESSVRKVWMPKTVAYILREWKASQDKQKEFLGSEYLDYNLVVALPNGRPCEETVISNAFRRLKRDAQLPDVVFHSLRHSSTTYKLKLNHGDIKATQGDTGHSQADMVTKVYAHILDEDRKVNAQKFESAFYANPDLRGVQAPAEPAPALDVQSIILQLQQSPELLSALTSLISNQGCK